MKDISIRDGKLVNIHGWKQYCPKCGTLRYVVQDEGLDRYFCPNCDEEPEYEDNEKD